MKEDGRLVRYYKNGYSIHIDGFIDPLNDCMGESEGFRTNLELICGEDNRITEVTRSNEECLTLIFGTIKCDYSKCGKFFCLWLEKFKSFQHTQNIFFEGGHWSDFGDWSECSEECNSGEQKRHRKCQNSAGEEIDDKFCAGFNYEKKECNNHECCELSLYEG